MDQVYEHPDYYELAFAFRDCAAETDVLLELARRFGGGTPRRALEVACGSAPHLAAFARAGVQYVGLDLSETMLDYARRRAERLGADCAWVRADIADFRLEEPVDLALVLLGSLYVSSTPGLHRHFDCVARALRPGGLYALDWCVDFAPAVDLSDTWEEEAHGVTVQATYMSLSRNRAEQTYDETLLLNVNDNGKTLELKQEAVKRAIYPQEFLLFIASRPEFEFVGWWKDWDLEQPCEDAKAVNRNLAVVRRTGGP